MDLSKLSDDELRKMAGRQETARRSVSDMSDDELRALAQSPQMASEALGPAMPSRPDLVRSQFEAMPWYGKAARATGDIARLAVNGVTFGFADKGLSMLSGDVASERQATEDARIRAGSAGMVAEIGAGVGTGLGAAKAGLTAARFIPQGLTGGKRLAALMGAGAVDGAAMGGLSGAGNTDDGEYMRRMAEGAAVGGAIGGAAPAVVAGIKKVAEPAVNAIIARKAPETFARRMATGAIQNSGQSVDDIRALLTSARADGQDLYTVADAMGKAGGSALNGVARGNSPAAMRIREMLELRQTGGQGIGHLRTPGQAERVEGFVREGLDASITGKALEAKLTGLRSAKANAAYPKAAQEAMPVDTTAALAQIDKTISPSGLTSTLADNPIQAAMRQVRGQLTNGKETLIDFDRVRQLYMATRDGADEAFRAGSGSKGAALKDVANPLREALEKSYPPFAGAQRDYANLSRSIEGIEKGREAAGRGLTQDVQSQLAAMKPNELGAARYGYADEVIKKIQNAAEGNNVTRSMTSEKFLGDLPAIARPGRGEQLQRRLNREGEMFGTRNMATGGSQTANNLADMLKVTGRDGGAAIGGGLGLDALGITGGYGASGGGIMAALMAAKRGRTALMNVSPSEAARTELAKALMSSSPDTLASMAARTVKGREMSEQSVAALARALGLTGIGAMSPSQ